MMSYLRRLSQISASDVRLVGGKAASLGELVKAGFPVPDGYILTTTAYNNYQASEIPTELQKEILSVYDTLSTCLVAVRSSAVMEDSLLTSWAGQLESYLNVSRDNLIESVLNCWQSLSSARSNSYAREWKLNKDDFSMAVIIQKMVNSDISGVVFTTNPVSHNPGELIIESTFGLGEILVQGSQTPDCFKFDKQTHQIEKSVVKKSQMMVFTGDENKVIPVPDHLRMTSSVSNEQIRKIADLSQKIEQHFNSPQDIEWAIEDGKVYILQSRPISTLSG